MPDLVFCLFLSVTENYICLNIFKKLYQQLDILETPTLFHIQWLFVQTSNDFAVGYKTELVFIL